MDEIQTMPSVLNATNLPLGPRREIGLQIVVPQQSFNSDVFTRVRPCACEGALRHPGTWTALDGLCELRPVGVRPGSITFGMRRTSRAGRRSAPEGVPHV